MRIRNPGYGSDTWIRINFGRLHPDPQLGMRIRIKKDKIDLNKREEISSFEVLDVLF